MWHKRGSGGGGGSRVAVRRRQAVGSSEDAIWDLQEINFMGVMGKNTPIKLTLSITLFIDRDQINSIGVSYPSRR
jgi:hypothetical protein